jgi:hypothetical protein
VGIISHNYVDGLHDLKRKGLETIGWQVIKKHVKMKFLGRGIKNIWKEAGGMVQITCFLVISEFFKIRRTIQLQRHSG